MKKCSLTFFAGAFLALLFASAPHHAFASPRHLRDVGNFSHSCHSVSVTPYGILRAFCADPDGNMHFAHLDLNERIENNGGNLQPGGSDFSHTCKNLSIEESHILHANCADPDGRFYASELDLDSFVANDSGSLVWS